MWPKVLVMVSLTGGEGGSTGTIDTSKSLGCIA